MDAPDPLDELADDDDEQGCSWCEKASGMILVGGAAALLYIGIDLLTGGRLSNLFVRGVTRAADAIDDGGQAAATVTAGPGEAINDVPPAAST